VRDDRRAAIGDHHNLQAVPERERLGPDELARVR
jgi:hypothetical protein